MQKPFSFSARLRRFSALVSPLLFGLAARAQAAETGAQGQPAAPAQASGASSSVIPDLNFSWSGYFEALAILCFVLALLWAVLWLVRRKGGGVFSRNANVPGMRVESRLALGPKKWLMVVRYLDRRLVIGLTDRHISLITEMPVDDMPPPPPPLQQTPPAPRTAPQPQKAPENATSSIQSFDAFLQQNKGGGAS